MRSGVGAVCIRTRAVRDAPDFFFVLVPDDELDFTGVTVLCVCEALVGLAGAVDFAVVELLATGFFVVDCVVVDCAATRNDVNKIHRPLASNNPPAARRIFVFALLNAPR